MLMTDEEKKLKNRIDKIIDDRNKDEQIYDNLLKEKGVECALLLPVIETLMGFDLLEDVQYESVSKTQNDQRFDFLLDTRFLIEAKRLSNRFGTDIKKQIEDYILKNDDINYGILSNGYDYMFFLQKDYIERLNQGEKTNIPIHKDLLPIFTISIDDELFFDIMKLFSMKIYKKNHMYEYHFHKIAKYILSKYNQGKVNKITGDMKLNEKLKELISKTVNIRKGDYLDRIKSKELDVNDSFSFKQHGVSLKVTLLDNGCIKLNKNEIDYNWKKVENTPFENISNYIKEANSEIIFSNKTHLIKEVFNISKLTNSKSYIFKNNKNIEL